MPLKLTRKGKIWHYSGTVAGRRLRGSTKTTQKGRAQRVVSQLEEQQWKCHTDGPESVLTFAQAAIAYRSAQKPTRFLERVEDYWKDRVVKSITSGAVRQAAIVLCPNGSGATRNRNVIVPTQAVINHAAKLELCKPLRVERFPVTTKKKEPATWAWVQDFMTEASPHMAALACFMFLTGARVTEATELRWEDVDLHAARALIRQTKIGTERRAHLPPVLVAALANIGGDRSGKVFGYSSRDTAKPIWRAVIRRAKLKPLSFHACRHGFATALLHSGVDPITVAKLGGWKDTKHVFVTYGHAMDDDTLADRIIGTKLESSAAYLENRRNIK